MNQDWKVLLISGSSATGKSYLARQLANYYKIPLTEVDDIRIALQQIVDKNIHPDLYFFLKNQNYLNDYPVDELIQKLLAVGKEIWPALDTLITKHITCNEPIIFEGDGIIPELLAKRGLSNIKAVLIYDSKNNLQERKVKRARGAQPDSQALEKQIDFSVAFGEELKKQAGKNGFLIIDASPLETLFDRVKEALIKF